MATESTAHDPAATLKKGVASLLDSNDFFDLTITCNGRLFKAHKAVICPQSRFFYNACKKNTFKVGQKRPRKDSETGDVDDDATAVEAMYRYFYECNYSGVAKESPDVMLLHVHVYCLAQKYGIDALKSTAATQFEDAAKTEAITAQTLTPIVKEIYENTESNDKMLREAVVKLAVKNRFIIFDSGGEEFVDMMEVNGVFGKDVFRAMSIDPLVAYKCSTKGYQFRIDSAAGSEDYRHNPMCPCCRAQHLIKEKVEQIGERKYIRYTCTTCRKALACVHHTLGSYGFWCAWCNGLKDFQWV